MAAYGWVCDFGHLPADCRGQASAPEPYVHWNYLAFIFQDNWEALALKQMPCDCYEYPCRPFSILQQKKPYIISGECCASVVLAYDLVGVLPHAA